jgi:hypothetical protein
MILIFLKFLFLNQPKFFLTIRKPVNHELKGTTPTWKERQHPLSWRTPHYPQNFTCQIIHLGILTPTNPNPFLFDSNLDTHQQNMSFPRIPLSRVPSYLHNSNNCFHLLHPPFIPVSKTPSLPTYQTARTYTDFNSQTQTQPPLSLPSLIPSPPVNNPNATHRWKPMCLYHTHGKCTKVKFQTFQLFISNYYICWFPVLILLRIS